MSRQIFIFIQEVPMMSEYVFYNGDLTIEYILMYQIIILAVNVYICPTWWTNLGRVGDCRLFFRNTATAPAIAARSSRETVTAMPITPSTITHREVGKVKERSIQKLNTMKTQTKPIGKTIHKDAQIPVVTLITLAILE